MSICAIVGAGPKIGTAVAQQFAGAGFDIVLVSRSADTTEQAAKLVRDSGVIAHQVQFDATNRSATSQALSEVASEIGVPEVLIYNPANMIMAPFSEVSAGEMEQTWPVMLYGAMNVVSECIPAMKKRGSGTIILTGGGFAIDPSVSRAPHSIAKAALRNYAHGLHVELREEKIHAGTVTVHRPIQPGEDMAACARTFLEMHNEPASSWSWERHYGRDGD